MKRRALFGLVGLTLGVSVIALVSVSSSRDGGTLTTAEVTEMELGVEVVGTLQAVDTSLVGPPMVSEIYSFKISMMAPEGTQVEKGTPVLGFDTSELMRKYQTRQTEMESVGKEIEKKEIDLVKQRQDDRLELAEAEARLRRADLKTATPSDLVSTIAEKLVIFDLELARIEVENLRRRMKATRRAGEAELAALKSNLDRATADVRRLQDAIARMTRTAPRDGVVTYVTDWRKEKKKVGDTVWIRSNVVEIPDLVLMRAAGEVEEALAGRIAEGQSVVLFLDAHPGLEFGGRIAAISRSVAKKSWRNPLKIVKVEIRLDSTDTERMRPGMRFKGRIVTDRLHDVLTVPADAVFMTQRGPVSYRRGLFGFDEVEVVLGPRNGKRVIVLDGLDEGDELSMNRVDS